MFVCVCGWMFRAHYIVLLSVVACCVDRITFMKINTSFSSYISLRRFPNSGKQRLPTFSSMFLPVTCASAILLILSISGLAVRKMIDIENVKADAGEHQNDVQCDGAPPQHPLPAPHFQIPQHADAD